MPLGLAPAARRSPLVAVAVGVVALLGLGACTSQPSAKAVAEDVVQTLDGLTEAERTCMLDKLDTYSSDEIEQIGEANEDVDFQDTDAVETQGDAALQKFVDDLSACMTAS
ncbi:MAG: hypothetical protein ABW328_03520 [Ilumatobacteraceae bacterium]